MLISIYLGLKTLSELLFNVQVNNIRYLIVHKLVWVNEMPLNKTCKSV
jgi:hypothetical protein